MTNNSSSKSGLFLMELIVSIFFFAFAGAICVRLFVSSHITSRESVELNHAVEWTQNLAETFYGCDGSAEEMISLFQNACPATPDKTESFFLLFDEDFNPLSPVPESAEGLSSLTNCSYMISVTISKDDELLICNIHTGHVLSPESYFQEDQDWIYKLDVELFPTKEALNGN